jgi:zinc protease
MVEWLSDGDYVLEVQPYPEVTASASALDRKTGAATGQPQALKMPALQKTTLSNGLNVLLAERHTAPVVNLSLLVDAGYASDSRDMPGLAALTIRMLEEGTPTRTSTRISEELQSLGATFETRSNLDGAVINLNTLKATLPRALDVYADVVLHPAFPANELERIRKEQLAGIQNEKVDPESAAMRVLPALLYGPDHAYALPWTGTGTEAGVKRAQRDDLVKYHRTWFRPNNATLLVVGDATLTEIKPLLEKAFGGWTRGDVPKKNIATVQPPAKTVVYLMDRPGSLQSVIIGAQVAKPADPQELIHLTLVNNVLGGTFSSRMNMNLREDKHWSYGVFTQLGAAAGQRPLVSHSPVQTDKTADALKEIVNEYAGVAGAKPITPAELKLVQERESFALPGRYETAAQLARAYTTIVQYKLPEDFYVKYTPTALALTPDQANALAGRSILAKQQVWVVVGDMAKVEAGIRALNLGEVHRIDADGKVLK